jgi:hypothetical protein
MTAINVPANHGLTPVQENVIAAITGGATMKAAAEAAAIHRNTISYWHRTSAAFCGALEAAQYDKALFIREEAESHVAFAAIHTVLTKPGVSDTARLNAAKYIIEKASTPPPPKPEAIYDSQSGLTPIIETLESCTTPIERMSHKWQKAAKASGEGQRRSSGLWSG